MAENSIGALWVNREKKLMSGNIEINGEKVSIIVFKNERKREGKKGPDYRIFESRVQGAKADTPKPESDEPEPF